MVKQGVIVGILVTILLVAILGIGGVWYQGYKQTVISEEQTAPGAVPNALIGKSSQLTVTCRDRSADNTETGANCPVYIQSPDGKYIATGTASITTGTDFTDGITVQELPYKVIAFNNTWLSKGFADKKIASQAETMDVDVYALTSGLSLVWFDEDGTAVSEARTNLVTSNITLSANEDYTFDKLRIKNNQSNSMIALYGIYVNTDEGTNLSVSIGDSKLSAQGSMPLASTSSDDLTWKFAETQYLGEYDILEISSITYKGDGDGASIEEAPLTVVDANYFYSSIGEGVKFGPETDSTTPTGTGITDEITYPIIV